MTTTGRSDPAWRVRSSIAARMQRPDTGTTRRRLRQPSAAVGSHSGDLGVMDADGYITVVDRKKDVIKSGGENVASREVEEVIYQHPAVAEVAVFGVSHPRWIEAVAAVIVPRDGETVESDDVMRFCRE